MNPNVDYKRVVDALADAVQELNRGSHAPHAPHAPHAAHAELSGADLADAIYEALLALERGGGSDGNDGSGIADAAAHAAAERGASSQEFAFLLPLLPWVPFAALGLTAVGTGMQVYDFLVPQKNKKIKSKR